MRSMNTFTKWSKTGWSSYTKENTVTNNGKFHPVPGNIVLIPLKGTVKLTTPDQECTIKNGQLAILGPTDSFYLTAIDDVEFVGVVDIK